MGEILCPVFFYVRYAVSYRGLEEIMAERCVQIGLKIVFALGSVDVQDSQMC